MDVVTAKVISIISLFFLTLIFALLPIRMSSWSLTGGRYKRSAVSLANCFSGGIFLGVALLHLLPEVREMFEYVLCKKKISTEYPVTELTVCGGFLMILVFEQLVLLFHRPRPSSQCDLANVPPHGCDQQVDCNNCRQIESQNEQVTIASDNGQTMYGTTDLIDPVQCDDTTPILSSRSPNGFVSGQANSSMDAQATLQSSADAISSRKTCVDVSGSGRVPNQNGYSGGVVSSADRTELVSSMVSHTNGTTSVAVIDPTRHDNMQQLEDVDENARSTEKNFGSLVLLAALSLHSLFEGLALGLQDTSSSTIQIFVAVLVHKCVLAFALGVRMVKFNSATKRIIQAAFIFAVMSPIGASIGIAIEANSANEVDRKLVTACLQGLATGTFLFITFLEVISHEVQGSRSREDADIQMLRLALIVIGFIAVALAALYHDPHGNEHDECSHDGHSH